MTEGSLEEWGLPSPEELVPLTQTLISPTLAAFLDRIQFLTMNSVPSHCPEESTTVSNEEEDAAAPRTLKRPRLVWTPQLHTRFVEAVHQLGTKNAVPKSIMQIMNVDGLTRENVASHLQKYRNYLKRHCNHHHLPPANSPFIFPFPLPSPHARSSSPNLTLIPQHEPNSSHHQFLPFFSTKGYS